MTLRQARVMQKIELNQDFKRDLKWFGKFLPLYNGISLYNHKTVDSVLDLDACLIGLGPCWGQWVYHLPLQLGYGSYSIVHLEMVNIFLALKVFRYFWQKCKILIRCDNQAVVTVLNTGKTRDPYLAACAQNVWYLASVHDIDLQYVHIRGEHNKIADCLSRWGGSAQDWRLLRATIPNPVWCAVSVDMLQLDPEL